MGVGDREGATVVTGPLNLESGTRVEVVPPAVPRLVVPPPGPAEQVLVPVIGPRGPQGEPGGGIYEHHQDVPATVWVIEHGLGRHPAAWSLYDTDGRECWSYTVQHLDDDTCRVAMDLPTAGVIRLV